MSMAQQRAEFFQELMAHTDATLREQGVAPALAEQCGCALADRLSQVWGGQVISIPVDHAYKLSLRERQILNELREGTDKLTLTRRYGITLSGLNKLIKRAQTRNFVDNQPDLFADATGATQSAPTREARPL